MISRPVSFRVRARRVIFEHDTRAGKAFDVALLVLIAFSVLLVMLESVATFSERYETELFVLEWVVTGLFIIEYVARLATAEHPGRYARSFFGIIDLLGVLPAFRFLFQGAQSLIVVRSLRLLRVFRIFKMGRWLSEANYMARALKSSSRKIAVFLFTVVLLNLIVGSLMYFIEGEIHGFDSMFRGVYWSIVTMSTVGFGDIAPQTAVGQVLAAILMITGYSVIAVPTGIVSAEVAGSRTANQNCPHCGSDRQSASARFCDACGEPIDG